MEKIIFFLYSKEVITLFGTEPNIINNKPLQKIQDLNLKVKKKKYILKNKNQI